MPAASPLALAPTHSAWLRAGRAAVSGLQRSFYRWILSSEVEGAQHVPGAGGFLVAANHTSHLDAGIIQLALGARGADMRALAAQDYFFSQPLLRWYFQNLTHVLPFERHGGFRQSLKLAAQVVEAGLPLLVFPEGTRSRDGRMAPFKPALCSLALAAGSPILPMYVWGTHEALPKGARWLRGRRIGVVVGPALGAAWLGRLTADLSRHEAYALATRAVTLAVEGLRDGRPESEESLLAKLWPERQGPAALRPRESRRQLQPDGRPMVGIA